MSAGGLSPSDEKEVERARFVRRCQSLATNNRDLLRLIADAKQNYKGAAELVLGTASIQLRTGIPLHRDVAAWIAENLWQAAVGGPLTTRKLGKPKHWRTRLRDELIVREIHQLSKAGFPLNRGNTRRTTAFEQFAGNPPAPMFQVSASQAADIWRKRDKNMPLDDEGG